ncbi:MAG: radical SAM family heme chaperone HemW [Chitinophagaceae bacterium]|nr:MAG: radical SAM family heme chaperone HemW [Chitinophagaceae bacterium]
MAGIYIHIPFCRQACNYCNFHFSTSLRYKNELLAALLKEMELFPSVFPAEMKTGSGVETIYIGGGTPSLLEPSELMDILSTLRRVFAVQPGSEITLEANPDDITEDKLLAWQEAGINRLSIGVQSFFEEDLKWMNRAHNATQAVDGLSLARKYFDNITMDLIYGTPGLTDIKWKANVDKAISLGINHLSCYALTVEPSTPLQKLISQHKLEDVDPDTQSRQFLLLMDWLSQAGYEHYEISNFARPGFRSRHNSSYWQGKSYFGFGPSAHSFNGTGRWWNIANNNKYIASLAENVTPYEKEILTPSQRFNEYLMISLRTMEGTDMQRLAANEWGLTEPALGKALGEIRKLSADYAAQGKLTEKGDRIILSQEGRLLADGIAADFFMEDEPA